MKGRIELSKADVRRAMVRHHFAPCKTQSAAFDRLRSIQFDPIAPVGCNHDLVLQARVPGYKIGDWQKTAYEDRLVYDGWDKQASLVPFEGWPLRRYFHQRALRSKKVLEDHPEAVQAILSDIRRKGPLMPKECEFQGHNEEWQGTWYGPSVTKQVLRALWHTGGVMTAGRRKGQHLYDVTERVVPPHLFAQPLLSERDALQGIALERHRALGLLSPTAGYETWSYMYAPQRAEAIGGLLALGEIVPVEVEGLKAHATPPFVSLLDLPSLEPRVVFVAPLDQLVWDRKFVQHVFGFDYIWEIYTPEAKRRWGYYVLPVLYANDLVARVEFWCRDGVLEMKRWLFEPGDPAPEFFPALEQTLREFMAYGSARKIKVARGIDSRVRDVARSIK